MRGLLLASALGLLLGACASLGPQGVSAAPAMAVRAGETADSRAIWVDPADRTRGVIMGAERTAGLYVYDLAGRPLQVLPGDRLANVDLREGFPTAAGPRVLVAASDRGGRAGAGAALFLLDPATLELTFWATVPLDLAEPQGLCLARRGEAFLMIVNGADGQVRQLRVTTGPDGRPGLAEERRFAVESRPEGCVADDVRGRLYLGEEGRGIWRYDLGTAAVAGELIAEAPSAMLTPDAEGLALLDDGEATWLVASSQTDSAFAVWKVDDTEALFYGSFSVVEGDGLDALTGGDGVAARGRLVGGFSQGLVVVEDDAGPAGAGQTYKLVEWARIKEVLGL